MPTLGTITLLNSLTVLNRAPRFPLAAWVGVAAGSDDKVCPRKFKALGPSCPSARILSSAGSDPHRGGRNVPSQCITGDVSAKPIRWWRFTPPAQKWKVTPYRTPGHHHRTNRRLRSVTYYTDASSRTVPLRSEFGAGGSAAGSTGIYKWAPTCSSAQCSQAAP
jgi:hypothetical protein